MSRNKRTGKHPPRITAHEPDSARYHRLLSIAMYVLGFAVCGVVSIHLGQDNNWDLRNYHFYNPWALLHNRIGFDIAPAQRQSYLNPIGDIPFYLGTLYLPPKLFGFLMGGIQGLSLGLIFSICLIIFRNLASRFRLGLSIMCALVGLYAPVFVGEIGTSMNDTFFNLLVLIALLLLVRTLAIHTSLAGARSRRNLIAASLLAGIAVGLKLTILAYGIGIVFALIVVERTWRDRIVVMSVWSLAFIGGFMLSNGYWMARLWHEYGNPLFPFYNNIFHSSWATPESYADKAMVPTSLAEGFVRPFAFVYDSHYTKAQSMFRDARYAAMYVILILMIPLWMYRRFVAKKKLPAAEFRDARDMRFLLVFFIVTFVVWQVQFSIIRYAAGLEAFAPVLIACLAICLTRKPVARIMIVALAFVAIAIVMRPVRYNRIDWRHSFWNVRVPVIADPSNALILQSNGVPWGYLVPMFPPEIRWVSFSNNFIRLTDESGFMPHIRELVKSHRGKIYLVSRKQPTPWIKLDVLVLESLGLKVDIDAARPIVSLQSVPGIYLYPVTHK